MPSQRSFMHTRPSLAFMLLAGLFATLCLAGGASRADVMGQVVVRGASWAVIIVALLAVPRSSQMGPRAVPVVLFLAVALCLVQLVPLPLALWQLLPGREIFTDAVAASGRAQSWRPWSIVPSATINAASSLVVPFAVWLLTSHLPESERRWLPGLLLGIVGISTFAGLLQFSGVVINNPFVNDTPGEVGGTFANRNHFALLLAMGCLLAPVWGFLGERNSRWRLPIAWGLVLVFLLTILANGSRAGLGLGLVALLLSLVLSRQAMRRALAGYPRWVLPAAIATIVGVAAIFVLISVMADRAVSINRLFAVDQGQDMRGRGLPVVLEMIGHYFPFGTGLGSFDPLFRLHEPFALLKPTFFNHAHNDFLEVVLDAGLPGALLLVAALGWWAWTSARAWQEGSSRYRALPRLGSALLFLVILASIVDYPARTPMIMSIAVIAAIWLGGHSQETDVSALPRSA
jgi:hypothetical protein